MDIMLSTKFSNNYFSLSWIIIFPILFITGCGYRFQGSASSLPQDVQTIYISPVENNTTEPGLGLEMTEILRSRFDRYGVVRLSEDKDFADAILESKILNIESRTQNVTGRTDIAIEQELTMILFGELRRRNGQVLWRNPNIRARGSFANVSDLVVTSSPQFAQGGIGSAALGALESREVSRGQQREALEGLMEEAARRLYLDAVAADF
jgi:outer membrane lipopolysaccharide assembly protein LptE/RlpB